MIKHKKIVISGATGFTGSNLVSALELQDYELLLVRRRDSLLIKKNCRDFDAFNLEDISKLKNDHNIHAIFHLATVYSREVAPRNRDEIWEANYELGKELVSLALETNSMFFHIESYLQFETSANTPYLMSKLAFSNYVENLRKSEGLKSLSLIFFDNYGVGDTRGKLLQSLIESRIRGESITINNPAGTIILTAIRDIVSALLGALKLELSGRFRVNGSDKFRVGDLSEYIANYPMTKEPKTIKSDVFEAESFPLLPSFHQSVNLFDFIKTQCCESEIN